MNEPAKEFQPPYNISWTTFITILDRIADDPPSRVDRSYLDSQSGFVQTYLISAYKAFGFITSDEGRPTAIINRFADPAARKDVIAELLNQYYAEIVPMGQTNTTSGELAEAFSREFPAITGESRRKGIRFFLSASEYAGLKVSPNWKTPKAPAAHPAPAADPGRLAQPRRHLPQPPSAASSPHQPTKCASSTSSYS